MVKFLNIFFFLKLKEINERFIRPPTIILRRPNTTEIEWYMTRL